MKTNAEATQSFLDDEAARRSVRLGLDQFFSVRPEATPGQLEGALAVAPGSLARCIDGRETMGLVTARLLQAFIVNPSEFDRHMERRATLPSSTMAGPVAPENRAPAGCLAVPERSNRRDRPKVRSALGERPVEQGRLSDWRVGRRDGAPHRGQDLVSICAPRNPLGAAVLLWLDPEDARELVDALMAAGARKIT